MNVILVKSSALYRLRDLLRTRSRLPVIGSASVRWTFGYWDGAVRGAGEAAGTHHT